MRVHIQSKDKEDFELFFNLLSKRIAIEPTEFESKGETHMLFKLNFKELHRLVTNRKDVTLKQDLSVNTELSARVGLYRKNKMSFRAIADKLNAEGFKNSRGDKLNKMQVHRLYKIYQKEVQDKL